MSKDKKVIRELVKDYYCPWCGGAIIKISVEDGKNKYAFKGCGRFPKCDWTDYKGEQPITLDTKLSRKLHPAKDSE